MRPAFCSGAKDLNPKILASPNSRGRKDERKSEGKPPPDPPPPVYEARTSRAGKFLVARLSRNHAQRAQRLLVKIARVFPHPYNYPDHASHLFLAKPQHFAPHARILLPPPHPRINFLNKLSYTKRLLGDQCALPLRLSEI